MDKVRKQRVTWTPEECLKVAAFADLYALAYSKVGNSGAVLKEAQRVMLPESRHRAVHNVRLIATVLEPAYAELRASEQSFTRRWNLVRNSLGDKQYSRILERIQVYLESEKVELPPAEPVKQVTLADFTTDELLAEIMRRTFAASGLSLLPTGNVPVATLPVPKHNPEPKQEVRVNLPSVFIFGANKPIHQRELLKDFGGKFQLRFMGSDVKASHLRAMATAADHVIILSDFVSHGKQAVIEKENIPFTALSGSITKLRGYLHNLNLKAKAK